MTAGETLASANVDTGIKPAEPYSAAWWESRGTDELRAMINGVSGTEAAFGAMAETERRAREGLRTEEQAVGKTAARNKILRFEIIGIIIFACMLVVAASILMS